jgi:hypothetical protein
MESESMSEVDMTKVSVTKQAEMEVAKAAREKAVARVKDWIEARERYATTKTMSEELVKRVSAVVDAINSGMPEADIQERIKAYRSYRSDFVKLANKGYHASDCDVSE